MRRRDTFLDFPAVANRLSVPLATATRRGDFPLNFPAVANGIAVSLATAFVADSVPLVTEFIGGGVLLIKNFRTVSGIYRCVPDSES